MTITETLNELREFVTDQAHEDSALNPGEMRYQEELVTDVLTQEAPNKKAFDELLDLYKTEKQVA